MMIVEVWIKTDMSGSEVKDTIKLDDGLSPQEIEQQCKEYIFQFCDWGFKIKESE